MRRSGFSALVLMSGWLFADLLLVLFLTVLSSSAAGEALPSPSASRSASPRPSGSAVASPSPTPGCPQSFELKPQKFTVANISLAGLAGRNPATRAQLVASVQAQMRQKGVQNQYAGLVLTFGQAPNSNRIQARKAALEAGTMLREDLREFVGVQVREFNYESSTTNILRLEVYFFVRC